MITSPSTPKKVDPSNIKIHKTQKSKVPIDMFHKINILAFERSLNNLKQNYKKKGK